VRVLLVTGGHPFEREPFFAIFDELPDIEWHHLARPDVSIGLRPDALTDVDVVVFYDMPGVEFTGSDPPVVSTEPSAQEVEGFMGLLREGKPMVFLHHAIAGWPAWDRYAEVTGGRFHYAAGEFAGSRYPASGYRFDVTHDVQVLDPTHPICEGLGSGFTITDELYLFPVNEEDVVPLMRSSFAFTDAHFFSADLAIRGQRESREGWTHPPGSDLVAWVKHADNSPVAYVQFGDGPETYSDENYRRVLRNAISWAGSSEAGEWARARNR
jgi:type 1 glutamine amidotransferase